MAEIYSQDAEPPLPRSPLFGLIFVCVFAGLIGLIVAAAALAVIAAGLVAHLGYDLALFGWRLH